MKYILFAISVTLLLGSACQNQSSPTHTSSEMNYKELVSIAEGIPMDSLFILAELLSPMNKDSFFRSRMSSLQNRMA